MQIASEHFGIPLCWTIEQNRTNTLTACFEIALSQGYPAMIDFCHQQLQQLQLYILFVLLHICHPQPDEREESISGHKIKPKGRKRIYIKHLKHTHNQNTQVAALHNTLISISQCSCVLPTAQSLMKGILIKSLCPERQV